MPGELSSRLFIFSDPYPQLIIKCNNVKSNVDNPKYFGYIGGRALVSREAPTR